MVLFFPPEQPCIFVPEVPATAERSSFAHSCLMEKEKPLALLREL